MIEIITLGDLKINILGEEVAEKHIRTTKLWKLLNLLIIHRDKPLHHSVIMESIWSEENAVLSAKSLHNLIYRLRKMLTYEGAPEFVQFKNNCYMLMSGENLTIDIHQMEDMFKAAKIPNLDPEKKISLLKNAVEIYNGEYILGSFDTGVRLMPAVNQFKRMYIEVVNMLSEIYYEEKEYDELIKLCNKGIIHEPLEGSFIEHLARTLRAKGQTVQAIKVCENYIEVLHRELGVQPPDSLNAIYKEMKGNTLQLQHGVDHVLSELRDFKDINSALFSSYDVFKEIHRYKVRNALRSGHKVYVILITINDNRNDIPAPPLLNETKSYLRECCLSLLRRGDVISEYSQTQIITMMSVQNQLDIQSIISRIEKKFRRFHASRDVRISFDFKATQ